MPDTVEVVSNGETVIETDSPTVMTLETSTTIVEVEVVTGGTKGDPGDTGPAGTIEVGQVLTGSPGSAAQVVNSGNPSAAVLDFTIPQGDTGGSYRHVQLASSSTWTVNHGLGFHPNVQVEDSAGSVQVGDVYHIDDDTLTISFSVPFSGYANCS